MGQVEAKQFDRLHQRRGAVLYPSTSMRGKPESMAPRGDFAAVMSEGEVFSQEVIKGRFHSVLRMLKDGRDPNEPDRREGEAPGEGVRDTPLIYAARFGYLEIVKLLIKFKANVNLFNRFGETPVSSAAYRGHPEVARVLLEAGADVEIPDVGGWTPLKWAALRCNLAMVRLLIEFDANALLPTEFRTMLAINERSAVDWVRKRAERHVRVVLLTDFFKKWASQSLEEYFSAHTPAFAANLVQFTRYAVIAKELNARRNVQLQARAAAEAAAEAARIKEEKRLERQRKHELRMAARRAARLTPIRERRAYAHAMQLFHKHRETQEERFREATKHHVREQPVAWTRMAQGEWSLEVTEEVQLESVSIVKDARELMANMEHKRRLVDSIHFEARPSTAPG